MRAWRGLLVTLSWLVWPAAVLVAWAATGPYGCAAGGDCYWLAPTRTLPQFATLGVLPPMAATLTWRRWRRGRERATAGGARAG